MTISKIDVKYKQDSIIELLKNEDEIMRIYQNAISSPNDSVYIVECRGKVFGIIILHRIDQLSISPTVFVDPSRRYQGIGTSLMNVLDQVLHASPYEYAECEFNANDMIAEFLEKRGYIRSYTVIRMERGNELISPEQINDQALAERDIVIRNYTDEDYLAYHNIVDVGFFIMRKKACAIQWYNIPSESSRKLLAQNCGCRYVLSDHGEMVAVCKIFGNDIALLGVRPDKQLQGYGTLMLSYWINKIIIEKRSEKVTIGVLVGNPAEKLYRKIGFHEVERHYDYVKFYKPESRPKKPIGYEKDIEILEALRLYGMLKEEIVR